MTTKVSPALTEGKQPWNHVINGDFARAQRGTSSAANGYGSADRWSSTRVGSTLTVSQQAMTPIGQTDVPHDPSFFFRGVVSSVAGATNFSLIRHAIEGLRNKCGKTFTITFYAKADAAKNIALEYDRVFGSGGGSTQDFFFIGTAALTTSWQRFKFTFTVPSILGKTIGTGGDDYLLLTFWLEAGSDFDSRLASLGNQSGTFDFANVALYEGETDQDFVPRPVAVELALCERYFCKDDDSGPATYAPPRYNSTTDLSRLGYVNFPVTMRAVPTITHGTQSGFTGAPSIDADVNGFIFFGAATAATTATSIPTWTAEAEL